MTRTHAILLGLGLTLALVALPMAVSAVSPGSLPSPVAAAVEAPTPPDDRKCSTCDGVRLMQQGDYSRAMHVFQLRAAKGDGVAMNNIAWMYEYGLGVPADPRQAVGWYKKAGDRGDGEADFNLADMYDDGGELPVDHALARQYREAALSAGYAPAMTWKGRTYLRGDGVPVDYAKAMTFFRYAYGAGDALAMNEIGFMYQHGLGVLKPDPALAWCWYKSAIANGYDGSNKHLAELTAAGLSPPSNCEGFEHQGQ